MSLITKLKLVNINAFTDVAYTRFIEAIQDRRTNARIAGVKKKLVGTSNRKKRPKRKIDKCKVESGKKAAIIIN